jgi:L-erythrulose 1-phosphate isomerase
MPAIERPWIGTSWKMNKTRAQAQAFARALAASSLASTRRARPFVIPPHTAIADVAQILGETNVRVGAQNMHWADAGPWTGEISAPMLRDVGATMVEIGHSERRMHFGETDETVALKAKAAVRHGLLALICVGDTRAEYEAGETAQALRRQVTAALAGLDSGDRHNVVIAYEPVWSIGEQGTPADPDFADGQHRFIKALSREFFAAPVEVIYGGSVNEDNCREFAARPDVDGLFIGRAAWNVDGFIAIFERVVSGLG